MVTLARDTKRASPLVFVRRKQLPCVSFAPMSCLTTLFCLLVLSLFLAGKQVLGAAWLPGCRGRSPSSRSVAGNATFPAELVGEDRRGLRFCASDIGAQCRSRAVTRIPSATVFRKGDAGVPERNNAEPGDGCSAARKHCPYQ